ncbi:MAG: hypothetical protein KJ955_06365 [Nanoarchaeota archaeon]|nr:hypothetical protein [Nanoarchaeota archaeon]
MKRLKSLGLTVITAAGIAGFASVAVDKPVIYNVPEQSQCMAEGKTAEECCVHIDGCGIMCYHGMQDETFKGTMNGKDFRYLVTEPEMYPQGCHLERGDVSKEYLVVVHRE